jgi:hypothetical protein
MSRPARIFALTLTATAPPGLVALLLPRPWLFLIGQWVEQHQLVLLAALPLLVLVMTVRHLVAVPKQLSWPVYAVCAWGVLCWGGTLALADAPPELRTGILGVVALVAAGLAVAMPQFLRLERGDDQTDSPA